MERKAECGFLIRDDTWCVIRDQISRATQCSMAFKQEVYYPISPQQNGVARTPEQVLVEMVRCNAIDLTFGKTYWGENNFITAAFIQIQLDNARSTNTYHRIMEGSGNRIHDFEIFGSLSLVHIPKEKRKKLDQKAKYLIFVGYSDESKCLRFLDKNTNKITISRDYKILSEKVQNNDSKLLENNIHIDLFSFEDKQNSNNGVQQNNEDNAATNDEDE
ncbi:Retrovirus-related Pol polyprotein from transposon TNT 1-94 [Lucilia cuprina]|nr:Retrovirus-related Pol polyprotein from transposon TNT 1-94 [Lucilia cuprina]